MKTALEVVKPNDLYCTVSIYFNERIHGQHIELSANFGLICGLQYQLCWCCTKHSEVVPIERLLVGGGDGDLRGELLKNVDTEGAVSISS